MDGEEDRIAKRRFRLKAAFVAVVYLLFLAGAAASVAMLEGDTMLMALYVLTTGLTFFTLVVAVLFLRRSPSEEYRERYMSGDDDDHRS